MPIDLTVEKPIRLHEAAIVAGLGRAGKATHVSTIVRWILKGVPGPDGLRVRLDAVRLGAHWVTTLQALQRFAEALTPCFEGDALPHHRTPTQRKRAAEKAARRLDQIGI